MSRGRGRASELTPHPELAAWRAGGAQTPRCGRSACWAGGAGRSSWGRPEGDCTCCRRSSNFCSCGGGLGPAAGLRMNENWGQPRHFPPRPRGWGTTVQGSGFRALSEAKLFSACLLAVDTAAPSPRQAPSLPGAGVENPSPPNRGHTEDRPVPKVPHGQDNWDLQLTPCLPGTQPMTRQARDLQPGPREGAAVLQAAPCTSAVGQGWTEPPTNQLESSKIIALYLISTTLLGCLMSSAASDPVLATWLRQVWHVRGWDVWGRVRHPDPACP